MKNIFIWKKGSLTIGIITGIVSSLVAGISLISFWSSRIAKIETTTETAFSVAKTADDKANKQAVNIGEIQTDIKAIKMDNSEIKGDIKSILRELRK